MSLRAQLKKQRGNKIKYYTNPKDTPLLFRKFCCPFIYI